MLTVLSPVAGHSLAVNDIPDPVFARGLVGPGCAITPKPGRQVAVAPVSGVLAKLHRHAYLVVSDPGTAVLVHLGIDTVHMQGGCFDLLRQEGDHVEAGEEVVRWDPSVVEAAGHSSVCAVVVLGCAPSCVVRKAMDVDVAQGERLFEVDF